ncbi:hypothetical protein [Microbispora rosea]|uniref:hypothetical protein n=1 Tax=Microbispora rosea TaxID=58117 RepID=UPI003D8D1785
MLLLLTSAALLLLLLLLLLVTAAALLLLLLLLLVTAAALLLLLLLLLVTTAALLLLLLLLLLLPKVAMVTVMVPAVASASRAVPRNRRPDDLLGRAGGVDGLRLKRDRDDEGRSRHDGSSQCFLEHGVSLRRLRVEKANDIRIHGARIDPSNLWIWTLILTLKATNAPVTHQRANKHFERQKAQPSRTSDYLPLFEQVDDHHFAEA